MDIDKHVADMTDREIAEQTLEIMRAFMSSLNMMAQNPIFGAMFPPEMTAITERR